MVQYEPLALEPANEIHGCRQMFRVDEDVIRQFEPVQRRAKNAAEQFGLQLSEIERLPFDLSALEDEGAFVNVDASNFGLLDRQGP